MSFFNGQYALVTGAARGIGLAIAERLISDGVAGIAILDYNQDALAKASEQLNGRGSEVLAVQCDVSDPARVKAAVATILQKLGKIDILVNNAGILRDAMLHKMSIEQWDAVLQTNLSSVFYITHEILPSMYENGYGRIVNLASIAAFGNMGQTNYSSSKAGVIGMTSSLARESAGRGVTVNCIAPGVVGTEILQSIPEHIMENYLKRIPMHRLGTTEEIAGTVSFLVGRDSTYITGECIVVSGGFRL